MKTDLSLLEQNQKEILNSRFLISKRKTSLAYLYLILAGFCGAHHFYLGRISYGIFYLLLFFTFVTFNIFLLFIPGVILLICLLVDLLLLPFYTADANNRIKTNIYLKLLTFNQALKIKDNNVTFSMGEYLKALEAQLKKCNRITDMDLIKMEEKMEEANNKTNYLIFNHCENKTFSFKEFWRNNFIGIIAAGLVFSGLIYFTFLIKQTTITATTVAVQQVMDNKTVQSLNVQETVQNAVQDAVYKAVRDSLDNALKKEGNEQ